LEEGPCLSLVTVLPQSVWREDIRPLLSEKEAARLRVTSRALKELVMGWPMRLRFVYNETLEAALTCFPATESLWMALYQSPRPGEQSRLVEVLKKRGGTLKEVTLDRGCKQLHSAAVLAGALPNLTSINLSLDDPESREVLSRGMLGLLEELEVVFKNEEQVAVLGHLRSLSQLRRLSLKCEEVEAVETAFPPLIPPSIKSLSLIITPPTLVRSLLRELPSMLQASDVQLESFELTLTSWGADRALELYADSGFSIAQVLRGCWSSPPHAFRSWRLPSRAAATRLRSWSAIGTSSALSRPPAPPSHV
jgi:hypothetical protein